MVTARAQVRLAEHTTLRLGGPARRFVEAAADAEIIGQVRAADGRGEPLLVLGGGSNLLVGDEGFPGTVVRIATSGLRCRDASPGQGRGAPGTRRAGDGGGSVLVSVAAGEDWDAVVAWSVDQGLAGLECLSGIPGLTGATPIQNVGAYGQEVAETVVTVRAYDRVTGEIAGLAAADCGFGYRTSAFKRELHAGPGGPVTGRFVILGVTFRLQRSPLSAPVRYRELARALGVAEGCRAPLAEVRAAVLALRRGKGMVLDDADPDTRSAGSFFINPVLSQAQYRALAEAAAAVLGPGAVIPRYPAEPGMVKVSAAWLIEHAGFGRGYPGPGPGQGGGAGPRISTKHTLALVNPGGATAASLTELAREIRDGVRKTFGVGLVPEPVLVGTAL